MQNGFAFSMSINMNPKKPTTIPGIYLITNNANGKVYVGQARKISMRWSIHKHHLRHGTHNNRYLQRAWDKLGEAAFTFSVTVDLSHVPVDDLTAELNFHEALVFSGYERTYNLLEPGFQGPVCGPETRAKLSAASKLKWDKWRANPEIIAGMHAWHDTPEGRIIMYEAGVKRWENPTTRAAIVNATRERCSDPAYLEKMSANATAGWADPEIRQNMVEGLTAGWADPEVKARRVAATIAGQKKALEDPDSKMSKRFEKRWSDPEEHARQSTRTEKQWSDPEIKEKMKAALKAGWVKRRARIAAQSA